MPEPAFCAYVAIWQLDRSPDGPTPGDLDDLGAKAFDVESLGGFDAIYDPARPRGAEDADESSMWVKRWSRFVSEAERRNMPLHTPRDTIAFMRAVGLIERVEVDDQVYWRPVVPVPLAEDVLDLDDGTRANEAELRWRSAFQQASNAITSWLVDLRRDAPTTEVATTLTQLAELLELDVDQARHGLATAIAEVGDISSDPHPETVEADALLLITVDWQTFDKERLILRLNVPGNDENDT